MTKAQLFQRELHTKRHAKLRVLDSVVQTDGTTHVFFARGADARAAAAACGGAVREVVVLNGAPIVICDRPDGELDHSSAEHALFEGRNVAIGLRNGQPLETVIEWLIYHHDYFGMTGAVIFNRGRAGEDWLFLSELDQALSKCDRDIHVAVVESAYPLGQPDMPNEHHPFCVAEAPGKDRMDVPPPDAWTSPLMESSVYEIARRRFLGLARAVANIDISDLLHAPVDVLLAKRNGKAFQTPFDLAAQTPGGVVQLSGQHCYSWRVRKGRRARFADHACVQFDKPRFRHRWCVQPAGLPDTAFLKFRRVSNANVIGQAEFYCHMAIRHPAPRTSLIVPKTSLIEHEPLLLIAREVFEFKPVPAPVIDFVKPSPEDVRTAIVTCMKNEGPFILEWLAYHQAIGVQNFLVYTNDCTDGTDDMFDLLQAKGLLQHRENPFKGTDLKPQHAALQAAEDEETLQSADWAICMDVDEFLNIKVGDGTLAALYDAVGDANMISCTWRLFGNSDRHTFEDIPTIAQFDRCAEEYSPKPHQAWGFKTLFRNNGIFKKMGVHRPKGLRPQLWDQIKWVNGSGKPIPREEYRNAWRSTTDTYGYDLVSLNHYAVRNAESFLVKRDRGRVNHVDRDQGLAYWFRMNNNATEDRSIMRRIPMMEEKLAALMADPEIAAQHNACVAAHRAKIDELRAQPAQQDFFEALTGPRLERLSRLHRHFGSSVFLTGPQAVPDDIVFSDLPETFFFTVEKGETQH